MTIRQSLTISSVGTVSRPLSESTIASRWTPCVAIDPWKNRSLPSGTPSAGVQQRRGVPSDAVCGSSP
jgi:hypothetical protein